MPFGFLSKMSGKACLWIDNQLVKGSSLILIYYPLILIHYQLSKSSAYKKVFASVLDFMTISLPLNFIESPT